MQQYLRFVFLIAIIHLSGCVTITSTDRKRIIETTNGCFSFQLPSPAEQISEHYQLQAAGDTSSFGYGEYHFPRGAECSLALQTIVHAKNDVRFSPPDEQLKTAIHETQLFKKPPPIGKIIKTIKIGNHDVSIIEIQQIGSKSLRAQVPFKKGSITFYIGEEIDRPETDLLVPFEEILRSARIP